MEGPASTTSMMIAQQVVNKPKQVVKRKAQKFDNM
jgi:hypothetical protein